MGNLISNAIFLATLTFFILVLGVIFLVVTPFMSTTYNAINSAAPNQLTDTTYLDYLSFKSFLIAGFYVLVSFLTFLSLISSFYQRTSFIGYVVGAVGGLIATPVVIYIVATFWNTFNLFGISSVDIQQTFITSFPLILFVNLLFGLASFIFIQKGVSQ